MAFQDKAGAFAAGLPLLRTRHQAASTPAVPLGAKAEVGRPQAPTAAPSPEPSSHVHAAILGAGKQMVASCFTELMPICIVRIYHRPEEVNRFLRGE